jgi:hypothetical protein
MLKRLVFAVAGMALLAPSLQAKVYYVNRGVKYHIGDDKDSQSVDSTFLDAYPAVGLEWVQAFTVSQEDHVRVSIQNIWGVDDCPYCKDMVSIDEQDMGRLSEENNHQPFNTPSPLAKHVVPGRTYLLRIRSVSIGGQADDFAIEGVSIETDGADVTFLQPGPVLRNPGEPYPRFAEPKPVHGSCDGTTQVEHWLPERDRSRSQWEFGAVALPQQRRAAADLPAAGFIDFYLKVDGSGTGDAADQFCELVLGDPGSGWVLSFAPGAAVPSFGNLKRSGRYGGETFPVTAWQAGWNQLRVARCDATSARAWLNGKELGGALSGAGPGPWPVFLRSGGLILRVAEKPI